ncbi:MAG: NAD(P)H-binding protein [Methanomethylophilus sp.]|jgi:putative NADH-flavin reductase
MKILILAATGRVADKLIPKLKGDYELVLYGHDAGERLKKFSGKGVFFVNGDLREEAKVKKAAEGCELAVLNFMAGSEIAKHVVNALTGTSCRRLIVTSGHCSDDETEGGRIISASVLDTTCIYMPWLRDNTGKDGYKVMSDDPVKENDWQVSHEGVARFIADLIKDPKQYSNGEITLIEA